MSAAAARLGDPIQHSSAMGGLMAGLLIGAAVAVGAVAVVGTGGLAAAAIIGAGASMGGGIGEVIGSMSFAMQPAGAILTGSPNVFFNGQPAARAHVDVALCDKHAATPPRIAEGSSSVFINGLPAARVKDSLVCGATIAQGSSNVFIGGDTVTTDEISPEVPAWVHGSLLAVGIGSAVVLAGPVVAAFGLVGGIAGGLLGNWAGGRLFGEGSDGQKLTMLGGSFIGGYAGVKGAFVGTRMSPPLPATGIQSLGEHETLPHGFSSIDEFTTFGQSIRTGLDRAGYPYTVPILQGSAVTGKNSQTGAAFDSVKVSDFDVALAGDSIFQAAKRAGIPLRSGATRTGPLTERNLKQLNLFDLSQQSRVEAGRPVNFMIFSSKEAAVQRSPSLLFPIAR